MSRGLWVPFIWITINLSRPMGYWFRDGTTAASASIADGSFIDRNTYLILIVIGLFILGRRALNWGQAVRENRWLFLFYLFLLISVVWSPFTFISFKRWFKDFGDVIMVMIIVTETNPIEALRGMFVRSVYILVPLSVLFMKYYPELGRYNHRWTWDSGFCGITLSKNELGLLVALAGLFLLWQMVDIEEIWSTYRNEGIFKAVRKVWPDLIMMVMCFWVLQVAQCATAVACVALGTVIFFGIRMRFLRQHMGWLGFLGAAVALFMLVFSVSKEFRGVIAGILQRDATLTTRTDIWEKALDLHTNPLLGSGFNSVWLTKAAQPMVDEWGGLSHCHNGYLETYLNCGLIGLGLLVLILGCALKNAVRNLRSGATYGPFFFTLVIIGLFYNYTEVTFYRSNIYGLLFWLLAIDYNSFFSYAEVDVQQAQAGSVLLENDEVDFDEPEVLEGAKSALRNRPAPSRG